MAECHEEAWEYCEQLYLLEVLVDEVDISEDAAYGSDTSSMILSAKVKFLDFPEMEVEPNELVLAHRQRPSQGAETESEIPGLPEDWEVTLASDLHDFYKFPQYRVRIPVRKPKPQKSYVITVMVPQIAVTAGEGLRYIYTALEKKTEQDIMDVIKAQLLEKMENDKRRDEEKSIPPVKFASGKSCLFRLNPVELINALKKFPLYVMMFSSGIVEGVPVNLLLGKVKIMMGEPFIRSILLVESSTVLPVSAHIEEKFEMEDIFGKPTGTVGLFVRLSCFGTSLNPPTDHNFIGQPKQDSGSRKEADRKEVENEKGERRKPEALFADDDVPLSARTTAGQSQRGPITWRRPGDKMPEVPKPKLATLAPMHRPLPPPPPRVEPPFDLAEHLPDLPRCTPNTPPPCYRRPGDPPLSQCDKEREKQLLREETTKAVQTESYEPTQRLPSNSPYIDRTVPVPNQYDPSNVPQRTIENVKQTPNASSQQPAGSTEPGADQCSKTCSGLQQLKRQPEEKSENHAMKVPFESKHKYEETITPLEQNKNKNENGKVTSSEEGAGKKTPNIQASDTGSMKEGNESKSKEREASPQRTNKKCTCQDLTPEQKKMKQTPPPCKCKRKGKTPKKERKANGDKHSKECPECERIRLNSSLRRALEKITALEAQHSLTDSKVDAILQEEYGGKGAPLEYQDTGRKKTLSSADDDKLEITADEREKELRGAFQEIIEAEVTKFEERNKIRQGLPASEVAPPKSQKIVPEKSKAPAEGEKKKKRKKKKVKKTPDANLEEILKWMYPGHTVGHEFCVRPLRLVPKTMGWLWNLSTANGLLKPGRGWRPGAIRANVNKSIKQWRKERRARRGFEEDEDEEMLAWGARQKRRPATPKSPGSKKAESIKYNPTLHMHKKNGFYYISMYPIRSDSMDELGEDPKPTMFKISAKHPDGSEGSGGTTESSSDQESYEIEFITPSAMRKQTKKPPKSTTSAQYLEEDFLPKTKKKKIEPDVESKVVPEKAPKKECRRKGKGKECKRKGKK